MEYKKKSRFIGKLLPKDQLPKTDGMTCCRWCSKGVKPPRRTLCSEECAHEIKIRTNHRYMKNCVYKRDRGVCQECQIDTKQIAKQILSLQQDEKLVFLKENSISSKRKIFKRKYGGGLWDADHILAVKDGGGQCGLDNLRTLCIPCHKKKTFSK